MEVNGRMHRVVVPPSTRPSDVLIFAARATGDTDHKSCQEDARMYRQLVALLCDDNTESLSVLTRILPRPLISAFLHLTKPQPPPSVASMITALSQASAAERTKLSTTSKACSPVSG